MLKKVIDMEKQTDSGHTIHTILRPPSADDGDHNDRHLADHHTNVSFSRDHDLLLANRNLILFKVQKKCRQDLSSKFKNLRKD